MNPYEPPQSPPEPQPVNTDRWFAIAPVIFLAFVVFLYSFGTR